MMREVSHVCLLRAAVFQLCWDRVLVGLGMSCLGCKKV